MAINVTHGLMAGDSGRRMMRRPQHTFQIHTRPWQIHPFLLAPVLPGETLKTLLLQSRVVTNPIKNALVGWWCEYYIFYVKHRDLPGRDDFTAMMLDPAKDLSSYEESTDRTWSYTAKGGIKWTEQCIRAVVDEYFRNEGETWNVPALDSVPLAQLGSDNWTDSLQNDTDFIVPDLDIDTDSSGTIEASEVEFGLQQWRLLRHGGLTNQTYEEWLSTYGVRPSTVELHKPELIRYVRDWTYPTNTVDPIAGGVASACSWSITERADKQRFFKEPGFIFGVSVVRPKIYFSKMSGMAVSFMNDAYSWLPAVLTNDPRTSLKKFTGATPGPATGPANETTDDYWVDMKDVLMYGDQYINLGPGTTDLNWVANPGIALGVIDKRYGDGTDADALFSTGANKIEQDGIVSLTIATNQVDTSVTI